MNRIFLLCALALSPKPVTVYDLLIDFIHTRYPGAMVVVKASAQASAAERRGVVFMGFACGI